MTRIERTPLPDGLHATAYRDKKDGLVVYVSNTLDAKNQRAAVMVAIRASRRTEWWTGLLPPAGVAVLVALRTWLWRGTTVLRAQPMAWAAGTTATVTVAAAAGAFYTAVPQHHHPPQSAQQHAHVTGPSHQGGSQHHASGHQPGQAAQPTAGSAPGPSGSAGSGGSGSSGGSGGSGKESAHGGSTTLPTPAPTGSQSQAPAPPASPAPSPSPSPSPSPTHSQPGGTCVFLLGVKVCLPV
jgi:uncharacterized membrane protein YgcG